ncbi:NAD(P)-binding domain-containing protein [Prescottella defluvii]|nr:NAD(P)-binding domain-containing protein [Prescottella defluvii]
MDIGFLGMGTMGRPMARNLARADYDVTVWNRSPGKAASVVDYGASEAPDLSDVLHKSIVCSALADDRAFADSVLSTSSLQAAKPGSVHVNLATVSPGCPPRRSRAWRNGASSTWPRRCSGARRWPRRGNSPSSWRATRTRSTRLRPCST